MRNGLIKVNCVVLLACIGLLATGGCNPGPRPGQYNIIVETDSQLCKQSMRVDIVAVAGMGPKEKWERMSMSEYWSPDPDSRRNKTTVSTHTMRWGHDESCEQTLKKNDPIWKEWKDGNAQWLFILADTPGITEDETGSMDARRLVLPLDKNRWGFGVGSIEISVTRDNVISLTTPTPE